MKSKFLSKFKSYFITGILVIAPALVTITVLGFFLNKIDNLLGVVLTNLIGKDIPGLGLIAFILMVVGAGFLTRLYIGNKVLNIVERVFGKVPFAKTIYNSVKQLMDFVKIRRKLLFKKPLLVPFPHEDSYSIGFLTSRTQLEEGKKQYVGVFVPTTPNPTSGYLLYFPECNVKEMNLSVEEAMKVVISGGIMTPQEIDSAQSIADTEDFDEDNSEDNPLDWDK